MILQLETLSEKQFTEQYIYSYFHMPKIFLEIDSTHNILNCVFLYLTEKRSLKLNLI